MYSFSILLGAWLSVQLAPIKQPNNSTIIPTPMASPVKWFPASRPLRLCHQEILWYNQVELHCALAGKRKALWRNSHEEVGLDMELPSPRLVLASSSPRRRELLSLFGIPYEIIPSQAKESASGDGIGRVLKIARDKCDEVSSRVKDRFVLAADTLVCVEGQILGKPNNELDAARMLRLLSGRWHEVHTGVILQGPGGFQRSRSDTTRVQFRELSEEKIARYIRTREPMDKAGAYAIQGVSGIFISSIEGSPSNVMGLPLCLVGQMLEDAGFVLHF